MFPDRKTIKEIREKLGRMTEMIHSKSFTIDRSTDLSMKYSDSDVPTKFCDMMEFRGEPLKNENLRSETLPEIGWINDSCIPFRVDLGERCMYNDYIISLSLSITC